MSTHSPLVRLTQQHDYQFDVDFGVGPHLQVDEPPPLGAGAGPTPLDLLGAAVGNCLSASLLFALRKFKQEPHPIETTVSVHTGRNAQNRLRVVGLEVQLRLGQPAEAFSHLERVLSSFEAYCTVTASVAGAIPVAVTVLDSQGGVLKAAPSDAGAEPAV